MKSNLMQQLTLYRYRYIIGLGILFVFVGLAAVWRFWDLPDGLMANEMAAATAAGHLSWSGIFGSVVNLPWTGLEWLSIKIFGASALAFRLPAVILMVLSAGGLVLLLKRWTRNNVFIISGFLIVTSVFFMSLSRSGTAAAMTTFLIITILLSAVAIIRAVEKFGQNGEKNQVRRGWTISLAKVVLCIALALLAYQEAGIYLVAMFMLVGVIHPETRLIFVKSSPLKVAIGVALGLVVIAPLIIGLFQGGSAILKDWLVLNGAWSAEHLRANWSAMFGLDTGFAGGMMTPTVTLVGLAIVFLGLAKLGTEILSIRSYLVVSFLLTALVLASWQPELVYLLFVPTALLTTIAIETLIRTWYALFPRNPYARMLAVVVLTVLISGLVWTSIARFSLGQAYDANVVYHYSQEYQAARSILSDKKDVDTTLVVLPNEKKFYQILQRDFPKLTVATEVKEGSRNIVLGSAGIRSKDVPSQIVTNWHSKGAVLLRIY